MNTPIDTDPEAGAAAPADAPPPFPWPPAADESVTQAFVDTWLGVALRPARFFSAMPAGLRPGPVLLYYLAIGIVAAGIEMFWGTLLPRPENTLLESLSAGALASSPLIDFLLSPLYLLLSLLLAAGVTHLLVLVLVPNQLGFGTTLRVFGFAYGPALLAVIPYFGAFAGFIWMTYASIIGVREAQHTSSVRAAAAVLLPIGAAAAFLALASLLLARAAPLLRL